MFAKLSKCEFWLDRMVFLGRVVSADGVSVDLQKIGVVVNWERAIIVKEVCSFLRLSRYYR